MINWEIYIDCGFKITKVLINNLMLLSNEYLSYEIDAFRKKQSTLFLEIKRILEEILPQYNLQFIELFGFSDKELNNCMENFNNTINENVTIYRVMRKRSI